MRFELHSFQNSLRKTRKKEKKKERKTLIEWQKLSYKHENLSQLEELRQ